MFVSIEKIYQTLEAEFHRLSRHLEFLQMRFVLSAVFSMFGHPDETLSLLIITSQSQTGHINLTVSQTRCKMGANELKYAVSNPVMGHHPIQRKINILLVD